MGQGNFLVSMARIKSSRSEYMITRLKDSRLFECVHFISSKNYNLIAFSVNTCKLSTYINKRTVQIIVLDFNTKEY